MTREGEGQLFFRHSWNAGCSGVLAGFGTWLFLVPVAFLLTFPILLVLPEGSLALYGLVVMAGAACLALRMVHYELRVWPSRSDAGTLGVHTGVLRRRWQYLDLATAAPRGDKYHLTGKYSQGVPPPFRLRSRVGVILADEQGRTLTVASHVYETYVEPLLAPPPDYSPPAAASPS